MIVRKFAFNKDGKIEFTWEELKELLDEVYLEGKEENKIQFWESPKYYPYYPSFPNYKITYNTAATNPIELTSCLLSFGKESALTLGEI